MFSYSCNYDQLLHHNDYLLTEGVEVLESADYGHICGEPCSCQEPGKKSKKLNYKVVVLAKGDKKILVPEDLILEKRSK